MLREKTPLLGIDTQVCHFDQVVDQEITWRSTPTLSKWRNRSSIDVSPTEIVRGGNSAAAVFGILNTILKPIMRLITVPFALLTFGLAWFFVSMLMLWLTTLIISDFDVDGFWNYVWATIIIWLVNSVLDMIAFSMRGGNTDRLAPA